jgi:hypothetical protein
MTNQKKVCRDTFGNRNEVLLNELRALLTCEDHYACFNRALVRTKNMLLEERLLKKFWEMAHGHNEYMKGVEKENSVQLSGLRKEMNLDQILPCLKSRSSKGVKGALEELSEDSWIEEAREWLLSKTSNYDELAPKEAELMNAIMMRGLLKSKSYIIGEHPAIALALFDRMCERFESLKQIEDHSFSPIFRSPEIVALQGLLKCAVINLIAEIPNLKSWGNYAVEAIEWKNFARKEAQRLWEKNRLLPRSVVAKKIHKSLKVKGINVNEPTVNKGISCVDPRTNEEKKRAMGKRSPKKSPDFQEQ